MDFKVLVEIPAGGAVKYEVNEKTGELEVDRFMFTSFVYPFNYGYIKGTKGKDGDPLDALIFAQYPVQPGVVIKCHAVGLLEMEDEAGIDTKIIAVPDIKIDPVFGTWEGVADLPEITKKKVEHFFNHMKELEAGKWVKIGNFQDREMADKEIVAASKT